MATDMNLIMRRQLLDKRCQLEEVAAYAIQKKETERLLKEVDSALERMDKGSYGLCKVCHEPIETERLIADPLLQFCLEHLTPSQQRALEADLKLARQIQEKLLPEQDLAHGDWEVSYHYEPAGLVSGDYCDLIPVSKGVLYFILGDVSGKGIAASMRIKKSYLLSSSEIIKASLDDLFAFRGSATHQDDLTIMAIRRRER